MFLKKYSEEEFKKKYNSMKQLDRIELQNKEIIHNNNNEGGLVYYLLSIISFFFCLSFAANYIYLINLGITSIVHIEMAKVFLLIGSFWMIYYFINVVINYRNNNKWTKSVEEFLEEHT